MRALVLAGVAASALAASPAHAVRINIAPAVTKCARAPTWDAVEKCLGKHGLGPVTVVRQLRGAKLVQSARDDRHGVYLYVERGGSWQLSGLYEPSVAAIEVLGLSPATVGKRTGLRVELGVLEWTSVDFDGVTAVPALLKLETSLFCSGDDWRCTQVMTACDELVRGATVWTFHGRVTVSAHGVHIAGDRRFAGPHCEVEEDHELDWATP